VNSTPASGGDAARSIIGSGEAVWWRMAQWPMLQLSLPPPGCLRRARAVLRAPATAASTEQGGARSKHCGSVVWPAAAAGRERGERRRGIVLGLDTLLSTKLQGEFCKAVNLLNFSFFVLK